MHLSVQCHILSVRSSGVSIFGYYHFTLIPEPLPTVTFHFSFLASTLKTILRKLLKMIIRGVNASTELLLRGRGGYIVGSHLLSGHQSPLRTRTTVLRCRRVHLIIGLLLHVKLLQKHIKISYNTRGRKASFRNGI